MDQVIYKKYFCKYLSDNNEKPVTTCIAAIDWKVSSVYLIKRYDLSIGPSTLTSVILGDIGYIFVYEQNSDRISFLTSENNELKGFSFAVDPNKIRLPVRDDFRRYTLEDMVSDRRLL